MTEAFPVPESHIDWTTVRTQVKPEIEERKNLFIYYRSGTDLPEAVICWSSYDAKEAQSWLKNAAFARCSVDGCGIKTSKLGDSCGNH